MKPRRCPAARPGHGPDRAMTPGAAGTATGGTVDACATGGAPSRDKIPAGSSGTLGGKCTRSAAAVDCAVGAPGIAPKPDTADRGGWAASSDGSEDSAGSGSTCGEKRDGCGSCGGGCGGGCADWRTTVVATAGAGARRALVAAGDRAGAAAGAASAAGCWRSGRGRGELASAMRRGTGGTGGSKVGIATPPWAPMGTGALSRVVLERPANIDDGGMARSPLGSTEP